MGGVLGSDQEAGVPLSPSRMGRAVGGHGVLHALYFTPFLLDIYLVGLCLIFSIFYCYFVRNNIERKKECYGQM